MGGVFTLTLADILNDQGHDTEAEALCCQALSVCQSNGNQVGLQYVCTILGFVIYCQGRFTEAQQRFEQSLAVADNLGEKIDKITPLSMLAEIFANQGNYQRAEQVALEARALAKTFGYQLGIACTHIHLGYTALLAGRLEQAQLYFEPCLQLGDELSTHFICINTRKWLGYIAYLRNDWLTAQQRFHEGLALARSAQRHPDEAIMLTGLGKVACAQGDGGAQDYLHQALHILQVAGTISDLLDVLVSLSQLWLWQGQVEDAARLLGFARQHPALLPLSQQSADQIQTALQARLPAERLSTIQQSVATMTVDEAIAYAFAVHNEPTL